jgi:hypothetical protein
MSLLVLACTLLANLPAQAQEIVYPSADGTIVDGGLYGPFDGVPDAWDWTFNDTGYEGNIALTTDPPSSSAEYRVVWEYNLAAVSLAPPVSATLTFTLRGATIIPFPDVDVFVFSYPADLIEDPDDFSAGPAASQGSATVVPFQPPTEYSIDVSSVVGEALGSGSDMVAFRFQIDPDTPHTANQAFIDALDSDQTTKPYLTIDVGGPLPGDINGDGHVDLVDYSSFYDCLEGPDVSLNPGCEVFDFDEDGNIDADDFAAFQRAFTG